MQPAPTLHLAPFDEPALTAAALDHVLHVDLPARSARARRLHDYYANPRLGDGGGPDPWDPAAIGEHRPRYAQEQGLPLRIVGSSTFTRKEVVIENDIAWRVDAGVDLLFSAAPAIHSLCPDPTLAAAIETALAGLLDVNGGLPFLHELAVVGSVFGSADVLLRLRPAPAPWPARPSPGGRRPLLPSAAGPALRLLAADTPPDPVADALARLALQIVPPGAGAPVFDPDQPGRLIAYVQRVSDPAADAPRARAALPAPADPAPRERIEILGATWWQRYHGEELLEQGPNPLGRLPLVHIQNLPRPFAWDGGSDVEPLIPLQDELNTRLSDRANRVTLTAFRMYLGKRIPDFVERKIGPGQMWSTDDEKASIEAFGGDTDCPSERDHIEQVREALDKTSGLNPLAAGVVRDKLGNLTSGVALRVTLLGAVARVTRKRLVYGRGLQQLADLALAWLDRQGALPSTPDDRRIELHWPPVLPDDLERELALAAQRVAIGVPRDTVLKELGYDAAHPAGEP